MVDQHAFHVPMNQRGSTDQNQIAKREEYADEIKDQFHAGQHKKQWIGHILIPRQLGVWRKPLKGCLAKIAKIKKKNWDL